jgi:hypothetical protein
VEVIWSFWFVMEGWVAGGFCIGLMGWDQSEVVEEFLLMVGLDLMQVLVYTAERSCQLLI